MNRSRDALSSPFSASSASPWSTPYQRIPHRSSGGRRRTTIGSMVVLTALCSVAPGLAATPAEAANDSANSSFGAGSAGWSAIGHSTLAVAPTYGRGGSKGARLAGGDAGTVGIRNSDVSGRLTVQPGQRVTVTAWVRTSSPHHSGNFIVRVGPDNAPVARQVTPFRIDSAGWQLVRSSVVTPRAGSVVRVALRVDQVSARQYVLVDDVVVTAAPAPVAAPAKPAPAKPVPAKPAPAKPVPAKPAPAKPAPAKPVVSSSATTTPATNLISATFDGIGLGVLSPTVFQRVIGGGSSSAGAFDDSSLVSDGRGGGAVRTLLKAGTMRSSPGNNGIVDFVALKRQVPNACVSYDIRFDSNFDWSLGGKLPGLLGVAPGVAPSAPTGGHYAGSTGWSGRLMWLGPAAYAHVRPRTNEIASYMYHPGQADNYGDNVWWNQGFKPGVWHNVKQCYVMNTVGKSNGVLRAWLDGTQVVNRTDYVYRTRNDVSISHLSWSIFRGGATNAWVGKHDDTIDIDNMLVTTTG